jgi:hypothetical protein
MFAELALLSTANFNSVGFNVGEVDITSHSIGFCEVVNVMPGL